jgi:hypothetical protein
MRVKQVSVPPAARDSLQARSQWLAVSGFPMTTSPNAINLTCQSIPEGEGVSVNFDL